MSQKVLAPAWSEEFIEDYGWAKSDPEHGRRLAERIRERVQHAMDVLDKTSVGENVVFEGHCPSGSTYSSPIRWDGTEECREAIAIEARRHAGFSAWAAWLRRERDVRGGILCAEMRTG